MSVPILKSALIGALLISSIPTVVPAQTAPQPNSHNLRCLIVAALIANSPDPAQKQIGMLAGVFYAGEVFGADPQVNLAEALKKEASTLKPGELETIRASCGAEMQARGKQISEAGDALKGFNLPEAPPPVS